MSTTRVWTVGRLRATTAFPHAIDPIVVEVEGADGRITFADIERVTTSNVHGRDVLLIQVREQPDAPGHGVG